tara:strand:- start:4550 stop:5527 length:978 start_codon:yes stop_codon:yes gene_type:complete
MADAINTSNAGTPQVADPSVSVGSPQGPPTTAIGNSVPITETPGMPTGTTQVVNENIPKPSNLVTSEDAVTGSEGAENKENPSRHEYWQSQHDKVKAESMNIAKELDYYKNTLGPINEAIKQNPQILDSLEQQYNGNSNMGQPQGSPQGNQEASNQPIVRPQRPHTYNEVDAYNDPESESFKYRISLDEFRDNRIAQLEHADQQRQVEAQQQLAHQQNQMVLNNLRNVAVSQLGYSPTEAENLVQFAQDPRNITLERIAKLYEMDQAPKRSQVEEQQKINQMQQQRERVDIPLTTTVQKGVQPSPQSEEDGFNDFLLSKSHKNKS